MPAEKRHAEPTPQGSSLAHRAGVVRVTEGSSASAASESNSVVFTMRTRRGSEAFGCRPACSVTPSTTGRAQPRAHAPARRAVLLADLDEGGAENPLHVGPAQQLGPALRVPPGVKPVRIVDVAQPAPQVRERARLSRRVSTCTCPCRELRRAAALPRVRVPPDEVGGPTRAAGVSPSDCPPRVGPPRTCSGSSAVGPCSALSAAGAADPELATSR